MPAHGTTTTTSVQSAGTAQSSSAAMAVPGPSTAWHPRCLVSRGEPRVGMGLRRASWPRRPSQPCWGCAVGRGNAARVWPSWAGCGRQTRLRSSSLRSQTRRSTVPSREEATGAPVSAVSSRSPHPNAAPRVMETPGESPPPAPTSQPKPLHSFLPLGALANTSLACRGLWLCGSCVSTPEAGSWESTAAAANHVLQAAKVGTARAGTGARNAGGAG